MLRSDQHKSLVCDECNRIFDDRPRHTGDPRERAKLKCWVYIEETDICDSCVLNGTDGKDSSEVEGILKDVTVHLIAAISLLENSPKSGAGSDKMFDQMIQDYQESVDRARAYLIRNNEKDKL